MADVSAANYIRMVQNLIERCLLFQMNQEECIETLSRVANIKPVITTVVWKELEKENKEFFQAYYRHREDRRSTAIETDSLLRQMIDDSGV